MTRIIAGRAGSLRLEVPKAGTRPTSDRVREAIFSALESWGVVEGARVLDLYAGSGALGLEAASRGAAAVTLVERHSQAAQVAGRNATTVLRAWRAGAAGRESAAGGAPTIAVERQAVQTFLDREVERAASGGAAGGAASGTGVTTAPEAGVDGGVSGTVVSASGAGGAGTATSAAGTATSAAGTDGAAPARWDVALLDPPYDLDEESLTANLTALLPLLAPDAIVLVERSSRSPEPTLPAGLRPIRNRSYGETVLWWSEPDSD